MNLFLEIIGICSLILSIFSLGRSVQIFKEEKEIPPNSVLVLIISLFILGLYVVIKAKITGNYSIDSFEF